MGRRKIKDVNLILFFSLACRRPLGTYITFNLISPSCIYCINLSLHLACFLPLKNDVWGAVPSIWQSPAIWILIFTRKMICLEGRSSGLRANLQLVWKIPHVQQLAKGCESLAAPGRDFSGLGWHLRSLEQIPAVQQALCHVCTLQDGNAGSERCWCQR